MKVCSLYGAGYYYLPGTDICIKFGGYVRYQMTWGMDGGTYAHGDIANGYASHGRITDEHYFQRARTVISWDTRQQTAYGTLRTYMNHGFSLDTGFSSSGSTVGSPVGTALYSRRAFIQIAGFTFGHATSYFDFFNTAAVAYGAGSIYTQSTGDAGWTGAWYTAQLGNGVSSTIGIENPLRRGSLQEGVAITGIGNVSGSANTKATQHPDFVGNVAISQAWGGAQVAVVVGDASGGYYGGALETLGHPADKLGWAASAGLRLNTPMIAPGNYLQAQFSYTEGLPQRAAHNVGGAANYGDGGVGFGLVASSVFGGVGTAVELTKLWSVAVSYEHNWNPQLKTSVFGSYVNIDYNGTATGYICSAGAGLGFGTAAAGCNPDFSLWSAGARTQWEPVRGFHMGLEVMYTHINTMKTATGTVTLPAVDNKPAGTYAVKDQGNLHGTFRVHRDILP